MNEFGISQPNNPGHSTPQAHNAKVYKIQAGSHLVSLNLTEKNRSIIKMVPFLVSGAPPSLINQPAVPVEDPAPSIQQLKVAAPSPANLEVILGVITIVGWSFFGVTILQSRHL